LFYSMGLRTSLWFNTLLYFSMSLFQNFCKFVFPYHSEAEGQRISFLIF
jgi:hypothetical protein